MGENQTYITYNIPKQVFFFFSFQIYMYIFPKNMMQDYSTMFPKHNFYVLSKDSVI